MNFSTRTATAMRCASAVMCVLAMAAVARPLASPATASAAEDSVPAQVERLDPALDQLLPAKLSLEKITTGLTWAEGPVWLPAGRLMFADVSSNSIRTWTPGAGASIFLQPSGYKGAAPYGGREPGSNGMTLDRHGRLTVAGHAQRDVFRFETMDPHGPITILADAYQGKQLSSPNDLIYRSDGSLYFSDPPYGLRKQSDADPDKQLPINGVYRIPHALSQKPGAAPDRDRLQLVVRDLPRPNGLAFSPDEKYLYVDNSEPEMYWMRYTVQPDGTLTDGKRFGDAGLYAKHGAPDGMKVDVRGDIYSAGPGGVWIFSPEGKHLGTINIPEVVGNVAWGDDDHRTLYITATSSVYRVRVKVPGIVPHVETNAR